MAVSRWYGSRIAREAKASAGPATAWLARPRDHHPMVFSQLAIDQAIRCPDPYVRMEPAWTVCRLAPDCSRIELVTVPRKTEQDDWLQAMGWEVANIHLGTARAAAAILADLKRRPARWLRDAATTMEAATRKDQSVWARAFCPRPGKWRLHWVALDGRHSSQLDSTRALLCKRHHRVDQLRAVEEDAIVVVGTGYGDQARWPGRSRGHRPALVGRHD